MSATHLVVGSLFGGQPACSLIITRQLHRVTQLYSPERLTRKEVRLQLRLATIPSLMYASHLLETQRTIAESMPGGRTSLVNHYTMCVSPKLFRAFLTEQRQTPLYKIADMSSPKVWDAHRAWMGLFSPCVWCIRGPLHFPCTL